MHHFWGYFGSYVSHRLHLARRRLDIAGKRISRFKFMKRFAPFMFRKHRNTHFGTRTHSYKSTLHPFKRGDY